MTSKRQRFAGFLYLLSVLLAYSFNLPTARTVLSGDQTPKTLKFEVNNIFVGILKHTIRISNPTLNRVSSGEMYVPIIDNQTARHYVFPFNISSSVGPYSIVKDSLGNVYASWKNVATEGKRSIMAEIDYRIVSLDISYIINSSLVTDYDKSSELYTKYTTPEEFIQSDDSRIIRQAQNLTSGQNTTDQKVSKIYNFVTKHIRYEVEDYERGALWALENGTGDCSEYSFLFIALCRAAGIPARTQTGFAFHSTSETTEDGHMWSEYYLENYGWVPVDATWQQLNAIDGKHFSQMQGTPEDIPYSNFFFNYTSGPNESELAESQSVTLRPSEPSLLNDIALETIIKGVQKINQAKFAVSLTRNILRLLAPSDTDELDRNLHESQVRLQTAIETWQDNPQNAQSEGSKAIENADNAFRKASAIIVYVLAVSILILVSIMLVILILAKRREKHQEKNPQRKSIPETIQPVCTG
jgi:hypothetical protein